MIMSRLSLLFFCLIYSGFTLAQATYNSTNNQLSLPTVVVGNTTYVNVVVSIKDVISIGGTATNATMRVNSSAFDLSSFWTDGIGLHVLQNCETYPSTITMSHYELDQYTKATSKFITFATGSFTLPNGRSSCSISGITGVINHLEWSLGGITAWTLDNVNIDASTVQMNWKYFWSDLYNKSSTIMASSTSSAKLTCASSLGIISLNLQSTSSDIKPFIASCIK